MMPNKSPEPTAVGACSSAVAVHVASRRWLSYVRRMDAVRRKPILGVLSLIAPFVGFYFWWRIDSDTTAAAGDYTGLAVPLAIFLYYAPCLLLATVFGAISLARRETPRPIAVAGISLAWLPIVVGYIRTHLF
jgi:hypothetical protein